MQVLNLSFAGIHSTSNSLNDQTINGGLLKADNIVIDQPNIAKSRRGFKTYINSDGMPIGYEDSAIQSLATYKNTLVAYIDGLLLADNGSGSFQAISSTGVQSPSDSKKIHYTEANKNLYVCSTNGILKLDAKSGIFDDYHLAYIAGVPEALGVDSFTSISVNPTAIPDKTQVAYRIVFGYKDLNNNLILGAPSDRRIFQNISGGTVNVQGKVLLPKGIDNSNSYRKWFYQVYRSTNATYDPNATPPVIVTPDDELQLSMEKPITDTDITNGYFIFEDINPESFLGSFLYTNETQEGITQANYQPPISKDIALYRNCTFYANTKEVANFTATLQGTDSLVDDPKTLYPGDSITIKINNTSFVFYAKSVVSDPATEFELIDTGDPSWDIEQTVKNFVSCVNNTPDLAGVECPVYAYYSSTDSDLPGSFTLRARNRNLANEITIYSSKKEAFFPILDSTDPITFGEEEHKNRVFFSKPQQPESVPLLNYIDVGSANYEIKRIVALRDSLFVLKTDGIYRISGESASSFSCKLFDSTTKIIAEETAVVFNNMIYCVADQGIITVSETGVSIISMPIENDLFKLSEFNNFSTLAFGIAYGSDRKYILFVPTKATDTMCTQAFVYNSYTNTFVRWDLSANCGIVRPSDVTQGELFLGHNKGRTYIERKEFSIGDYCDDEYQVKIIASQENIVTLPTLSSEVKVGYTIKQGVLTSIIEKIEERIVIPEDPGDPPYTVFDLKLSNNSIYDPYNATIEHNGTDYPITIVDSVAYTVTLYSIPDNIEVGDTIKQGSLSSTISAIDTIHKTLTLSNSTVYDIPDNATIYEPIKKVIEWFPITCNNPSFFKHFREITFMFLEAQFRNLSFSVYSDSSPDSEETQIVATSLGAWGYGGWGILPWGGEVGGRQAIRSYIPLEKSRCRWLDLTLTSNQALTQFEVSGISLMYSLASERDEA